MAVQAQPIEQQLDYLKSRIGFLEYHYLVHSLVTGTLPPWSEISRRDTSLLLRIILFQTQLQKHGTSEDNFLYLLHSWQ